MTNKAKPQIRFNGFTNVWEEFKFGDCVTIQRGGSPRPIEDYITDEDDGINWIKIGDVSPDSRYIIKTKEKIKPEGEKHSRRVKPGDLILSNSMSFGRPYIMEIDGCIHDGWLLIRNDKEKFDMEYLLQLLSSNYMYSQYKTLASGGVVTNLNSNLVQSTMVLIPNKVEQIKIGIFFERLDRLINSYQSKYEKFLSIKKQCLKKMFPIENETKPQLRFKSFTNDWKKKTILDLLIQPITDGPHETPMLVESGIPFISVDAIVDNKIDFTRKRGFISEEYDAYCCKKYKPQINDVYLVKSGSTVGKVAIVETNNRFNIWSPLAAMRCNDNTDPYYLYYLLQTEPIQSQVADKASSGTQPNLSMRMLEKFELNIPSTIEEQKQISNYFKQLDKIIELYANKRIKLQNIKSSLLEKMFV